MATSRAAQGLPVFPATPNGLQQAFARFAIGRHVELKEETHPRPLPIRSQSPSEAVYLESLLEDALMWAADCTCLQPCSPALAERLREEFHSELPTTALQRIYRLEGTTVEAAGIVFDQPMLRLLRTSWLARRTDDQQVAVLEFIAQELRNAKPASAADNATNLAELTWRAALARVQLEIDPNVRHLQELGRLASSPVGQYLATSLAGFSVSTTDAEKASLRVEPTDPHAGTLGGRRAGDWDFATGGDPAEAASLGGAGCDAGELAAVRRTGVA